MMTMMVTFSQRSFWNIPCRSIPSMSPSYIEEVKEQIPVYNSYFLRPAEEHWPWLRILMQSTFCHRSPRLCPHQHCPRCQACSQNRHRGPSSASHHNTRHPSVTNYVTSWHLSWTLHPGHLHVAHQAVSPLEVSLAGQKVLFSESGSMIQDVVVLEFDTEEWSLGKPSLKKTKKLKIFNLGLTPPPYFWKKL